MAMTPKEIDVKVNLLPGQVTREQALQIANELVAKWTGQVKNERGYVHDKWTPADLPSVVEAVLRISEFLMQPDALPPRSLLEPPTTTLFGWNTNGSMGPPTQTQYAMAKETLRHWRTEPNPRPRMKAEFDAVFQLIAAYEEANGIPEGKHEAGHPPQGS